MKSHTSLVAQQTRLSEWADLIRVNITGTFTPLVRIEETIVPD